MQRLSICIVLFLTMACSGENQSTSKKTGKVPDKKIPKVPPPVNYWKGIDFKDLPSNKEALSETVRLLQFSDGINIEATYKESDNTLLTVCRVQTKSSTTYKVCLKSGNNNLWSIQCLQSDQTTLGEDCTDTFNALSPASTETALDALEDSDANFCYQGDPVEDNPTLQCQDDWGFVAFKGDEGYAPKRICRLHRKDKNFSGRCFDGVREESGSETPIAGALQATTWEGYRHPTSTSQGNIKEVVYGLGEILKDATIPPVKIKNAPENPQTSFSLETGETECRLDNTTNGTLTGLTASGECPVTLLIKAQGFVDKSIVSTVTVKEEQNATWEGYPRWIPWHNTGDTIAAGAIANEDGSPQKAFSSNETSRCIVDPDTGTITVAGDGLCEISLTLEASGFITKIFKTNIENKSYDTTTQNQLNTLTLADPYGANPALTIPDNARLPLATAPIGQGDIKYRSTTVGVCEVHASTGAINAIGSGNCVIQAQAIGNVQAPPSVWTELLNITVTSTLPDLEAIAGFSYSELSPKLSDTNPTLTAPTAPTGAEVSFAYSTTAETSVCTVSSAGVLSMKGPGDCPVTVVATKSGHNPSSETVSITIANGEFSSLTWASFPAAARFGRNQTLNTSPVAIPAADNYTIANQSGPCAWNNTSKELSFTGTGDCILQVTANKINYDPKTERFTVTVGLGAFASIAWSAFPSSATVDEATSALASPTSAPPFDSHSIAKKSGDCSWDNTNKTIAFSGTTPCVLTVTVSKLNYENGIKDFSVTPGLAPINVGNWGTYNNGAVGGSDVAAATLSDLNPSSVSKAYQPLNQSVCTVNTSTGVVTPVLPGTCRVRLTLSKAGYNDKSHEYSFTIVTGTQSAISGFTYSSLTPKLSDTAPTLTAPTAPLDADFTYATTAAATICTVSSSGVVVLKGTGDCPVTVTASRTNYDSLSNTVTIVIGKGEFSSLTWPSFPSSAKVGASVTLASPVSVPSADDYTIAHESGSCAWNNSSKELSFSGTGTCELSVSAAKAGYTAKRETFTVTVGEGSFTSISWADFPSSATVGTPTAALGAPTSVPAFDGHTIAKKSGDCSWNNTTQSHFFYGKYGLCIDGDSNQDGL